MFRLLTIIFSVLPVLLFGQLSLLDDEFDRTCNLYEWKNIQATEGWEGTHLEVQDVNLTEEGSLTLIPYTTAWYQNFRSTLLYKNVAGNFVFTTKVTASNRANNGLPSSQFSLAGAMLRAPTPTVNGDADWIAGQEDYVFLSLGFASTSHSSCNGCPGPHFEVKSTTNSSSQLNVSQISVAEATIRIAKVDDAIVVLYALPGENFQVRQRYYRPDLDNVDSLQVGFVAYTDYFKFNTYNTEFANDMDIYDGMPNDPNDGASRPFNPDIEAHYDFARFEEYIVPAQHSGDNYYDSNDISDTELISEFGYASVPAIPTMGIIWKGTSENWNDSDNWTGGVVPNINDTVIIPNCSCPELTNPVIQSGNLILESITIEQGAQLTVNSNATLTVNSLVAEGNIICEGDCVIVND